MDHQSSKTPFKPLGRRLKALRDKAKESLAEASGAVEIDARQLASYELGQSKPSEEVLLMLISHFGAHDDEAVRLWELAGYGVSSAQAQQSSSTSSPKASLAVRQTNEEPIMFTDVVDVIVNNYGVVMNFMQNSGAEGKPKIVARVGMSREHAKSVMHILQATLNQTEQILPKLPNNIVSSDNAKPDERQRN